MYRQQVKSFVKFVVLMENNSYFLHLVKHNQVWLDNERDKSEEKFDRCLNSSELCSKHKQLSLSEPEQGKTLK